MSAGIYANINGVTRKGRKLYAKINGVTREIKELWVKVNGVSRKIYQSGITWTYTKQFDEDGGSGGDIWNNSTYTCVAGGVSHTVSGSIIYTFNNGNGFLMHAGQTIHYKFYITGRYGGFIEIYVNGSELNIPNGYATLDAIEGDYTFATDTQINSIKIYGYTLSEASAYANVTINSDYGSFNLDSACTSDQ